MCIAVHWPRYLNFFVKMHMHMHKSEGIFNILQQILLFLVVCTEMMTSDKNAVWRDMEEGKSRCLLHLCRHQEALDCVNHLVGKSFT